MEHHKTEINKDLFSAWVADPSGLSSADLNEIESMMRAFPYCQIMRSFNAKAQNKQNDTSFNSVLARASLYAPNRRVLFNLLNHPEKLQPVSAVIPAEADPYYEVIEDDDSITEIGLDEEVVPEAETLEAVIDEEELAPVQIDDQPAETVDLHKEQEAEVVESEGIQDTEKEIADQSIRSEEDKMILESIAAADFFAFDEKVNLQPDAEKENFIVEEKAIDHDEADPLPEEEPADNHEMARYDDDSMPYSFLWWLHKTRKDHADTYQPYVDFKLDTSRQIRRRSEKELDHQIIENIFHLQSPLDDIENSSAPQTVPFELKRKEEDIIEKFIREEPQIHPPSPDKLDMENKARKSAEDPNDLVSETLATIYTEQMLFHKAIDTYKKLSLKFPEKRAYFADQISELQKKIN